MDRLQRIQTGMPLGSSIHELLCLMVFRDLVPGCCEIPDAAQVHSFGMIYKSIYTNLKLAIQLYGICLFIQQ